MSEGGGPSVRNNNNRPGKPNMAPPISPNTPPNIRPVPISEKDKLTLRSNSITGRPMQKVSNAPAAYTVRSMPFMHQSLSGIKQDYDYGKYLVKHKYNMMGPGRQLGVSYKTLLKHDLDKFKPRRYNVYSDWFFSPQGVKGTKDPELYRKFRESVDEHYENNPHHYHKINKEQPQENKLEALVDWYSVSKTTGKTMLDFKEWYLMNRDKLPIDGPTKVLVDYKLTGGLLGD